MIHEVILSVGRCVRVCVCIHGQSEEEKKPNKQQVQKNQDREIQELQPVIFLGNAWKYTR